MSKNRGIVVVTHKRADLDVVASIHILGEYGEYGDIKVISTGSGDEVEPNSIGNIIEIDRGRGEFDHHGKGRSITSTSIIAEKLGIEKNLAIHRLLRNVELNDLRGVTEQFQVGDLIKKLAHSKRINDEQVINLGTRIVRDAADFQELYVAGEIQRDHNFTMSVIRQFMDSRKFIGQRLRRYCELLKNPKFQRPFDFCEVLTIEKFLNGAKEARRFGLKILALVTEQERNFNKGLKELDNLETTKIYNVPNNNLSVILVKTDNPEISRAARWKYKNRVAFVVQQSSVGIQIYPNFRMLKDITVVDNIMAVIRLEEQIVSGKRLTTNYETLKRSGRLSWLPEWYYFVSPEGGRFILNRSLTATEEIPKTKISPERIAGIVQLVIMHGKKFDFIEYAAERISHNITSKEHL